MFEGFDHQTVKVGDIEVAYAIGGTGPALLLLHGYPQNRFMWAKVAPLLADRFTVVCGDLRGYGDTSKPVNAADNSTYSFRAMAEDQVKMRSEEHTSELQSLMRNSYAVFCLKKKNKTQK